MQWPITNIPQLFHVGHLDYTQKRPNSHEGSGLSVSTEPAAWERINPETAGPWYTCVKPDHQFLDAYALSDTQKDHVVRWGLRQQWVEPQRLYRASWFDDELEYTVHIDFMNYDDALAQAEDPENVSEWDGYSMSKAMQTEVGYTTTEHNPFDLLLTIFADHVLEFDGIWWDDTLDICRWSAPRGVIFNRRLNEWTFVNVPGHFD